MFKKKKKEEIPQIDYDDIEPSDDSEEVSEVEEPTDTEEETPKPTKVKPKDSTEHNTVSEYLDVVEGNIRRAYLALDELRKLAKL